MAVFYMGNHSLTFILDDDLNASRIFGTVALKYLLKIRLSAYTKK
jgi:hypothetical protein